MKCIFSVCSILVQIMSFSGLAEAGEYAYTCEVSHVYDLGNNGLLKTLPALENVMKENSFSVSRETGALIGNSLTLDTSLAKSIHVINKGSTENSFEAIADFGDFKNGTHPFQFIKIEEFSKGVEKPFVVMGEVGIVTGICK
jgi:hypothetical protein